MSSAHVSVSKETMFEHLAVLAMAVRDERMKGSDVIFKNMNELFNSGNAGEKMDLGKLFLLNELLIDQFNQLVKDGKGFTSRAK